MLSPVERQLRAVYAVGRRDVLARCGATADRYFPGARWDGTWRRLVEFAGQNEADPFDLVVSQFEAGISARLLEPNQLLTPAALRVCLDAERALPSRLANDLKIQVRSLQLASWELERREPGVPWKDRVTAALMTESDVYSMGALFRFCVARAEQLPAVAEGYEPAAAYAYWPRHRHYDAAWGALIPAALKRSADRLYWGVVKARLKRRRAAN
jgi:hypothetical protein